MPAGYPPLSVWGLQVGGTPAPGGAQVHGVRLATATLPSAWLRDVAEPERARHAWLAALGASRDRTAFLAASHGLHLEWHSRELLCSQVRLKVHSFDAPFALVVRDLLRAGSLTADEARAARPPIALNIDDWRGDRSQPLPEPKDLLAPAR